MPEQRVSTQEDVFAAGEGDSWFERNRHALVAADLEHDVPMVLMQLYGLAPTSVLEIGAANGYRLAAIRQRYGCRVVGVEPSMVATADGKLRFPGVELHRGRADDVPLDEEFDLVIVNFVFHWVGREKLLRAVSEVDRLTRNHGLVAIGDFMPTGLLRRSYHHVPDGSLFTYKQNYAATFIASGGYEPVALLTGSHVSRTLTADASNDDKVGTWLLRKRAAELYQDSAVSATASVEGRHHGGA